MFGSVSQTVPFWEARPSFSLGLALAMLVVPLYAGWLIRQLREAIIERERAYAAKAEFTARMSHELRTPLHAIISTAEILKYRSTDAYIADLVNLISVSSSTLLELVNKVLDLSKFESGSYELASEEFDLNQLLAECVLVILPQAEAKGLVVYLEIDSKIPKRLRGASAELKEIFINLLGNAVKFTEEGEVSFSVMERNRTDDYVELCFEIRDTGIGIPEDSKRRILDPYYQADTSITRKHGGTGLGTAFARELVRLMNGSIAFESQENCGTKFVVGLGFEIAQPCARATSGVAGGLTAIIIGSGLNQTSIAAFLQSIIAAIHVFENVTDAVYFLCNLDREQPVACVFLDVSECIVNVPGALQAIRQASLRIFPVVLYGDAAFHGTAMANGAMTYLPTPISANALSRTLRQFKFDASHPLNGRNEADLTVKPSGLKILIADDDATNRMLLRTVLEGVGHEVFVAKDGDEAIFELVANRYDCAILDMHMPGRDGIEVCRLYKFVETRVHAPAKIILLTADTTNEAKRSAAIAGVDSYITKPARPSTILSALTAVVASTPSAQAEPIYSRPGNQCRNAISIDITLDPTLSTNMPGSSSSNVPAPNAHLICENDIADILAFMTKAEQTEFFQEFCDDAVAYMAAFEDALNTGDVKKALDELHTLAGAAYTIGAHKLADYARSIERLPVDAVVSGRLRHITHLVSLGRSTLDEIALRYLAD
ncbi:MAG: response regulator [Gammaproteobacteria bacterium]